MGNWITDPERVALLMDLHNYEIALEWLKKNQMPRCKLFPAPAGVILLPD